MMPFNFIMEGDYNLNLLEDLDDDDDTISIGRKMMPFNFIMEGDYNLNLLEDLDDDDDAVLLTLHAANSYILLTANLEDVHSLAKQIAASPVANQLSKIINRASSIFNQQYNKASNMQMRTGPNLDEAGGEKKHQATKGAPPPMSDDDFEVWKPNSKDIAEELNAKTSDSSSEVSGETNDIRPHRIERRQQVGTDLTELGKNASFYLKSIKKIFEDV